LTARSTRERPVVLPTCCWEFKTEHSAGHVSLRSIADAGIMLTVDPVRAKRFDPEHRLNSDESTTGRITKINKMHFTLRRDTRDHSLILLLRIIFDVFIYEIKTISYLGPRELMGSGMAQMLNHYPSPHLRLKDTAHNLNPCYFRYNRLAAICGLRNIEIRESTLVVANPWFRYLRRNQPTRPQQRASERLSRRASSSGQ